MQGMKQQKKKIIPFLNTNFLLKGFEPSSINFFNFIILQILKFNLLIFNRLQFTFIMSQEVSVRDAHSREREEEGHNRNNLFYKSRA